MRIDGRVMTVGKLFRSGRYQPARVQREYRWGSEQQIQLLDDLDHAFRMSGRDPDELRHDAPDAPDDHGDDDELVPRTNAPAYRVQPARRGRRDAPVGYFLGPMILQRSDRAPDLRFIYDGQQRLTTLALLLSVLRDALPEGTERNRVRRHLLREDGEPRLEAPTDGGAVRRITGADEGARPSGHAERSDADRRMFDGVERYLARTGQWSLDRIRAFLDFLLDEVAITVTFVDDRKLAETAYITVNTRGLRLDPAEVIKGQVVQAVSLVSSGRAQAVAETWNRLRREAGSASFEALLRSEDFRLFGEPRTHDFGTQLLDRLEDPILAEEWVLADLPLAWSRLSTIVTPPAPHQKLDPRALILARLGFLGWTEWHRVAIVIVERWKGEEQDERLRRLLRACYTMHLLGWGDQPARRARRLRDALEELDHGMSPFRSTARGRTGHPGPLHFGRANRLQARGALAGPLTEPGMYGPLVRFAESCQWQDDMGFVRGFVTDGGGAVEHVLPKTVGRPWFGGFPDEEERETVKHMLGNLCLVPSAVRRSIGDGSFDDKRRAYLSLDKTWRSAHDVARFDHWDAQLVKDRTFRLASRIAQELGLR